MRKADLREAAIPLSKTMQLPEQVEASADGRTVWVHALDGSTVGRFSTLFGMDAHTSITEQLAGAAQCLQCTHGKPTHADWLQFCALMQEHHDIAVDPTLIAFEAP